MAGPSTTDLDQLGHSENAGWLTSVAFPREQVGTISKVTWFLSTI